jgi:hypothetical protein
MRRSWIVVPILVVAIVVGHDAYMASTGHAEVVATRGAGADASGRHGHQHHGTHDQPGSGARDDAAPEGPESTHCEPLRVAAPANRDMAPSFDTIQVALLPDPASSMLFASTSRDIVETPPAHPPDLVRAFFGVYRI